MSKQIFGIIFILLLGVLPLGLASAVTPTITLNPSTGIVTVILGIGFAPSQEIKIYWNDIYMVSIPYNTTLVSESSGNFVCMIVALNQTSGNYTIRATDGFSNATETLTVPVLTGEKGETGEKGDTGERGIQGIQGIQGETGATGIQGIQGIQGIPGIDGLDGTMWFNGTSVPSPSLGVNGDLYLNTNTNNIYKKVSGTWKIITNIKGDKGDEGVKGDTGATGDMGAIGPMGPRGITGETGVGIKGDKGDRGDVGATGATGEQGPTGETGQRGIDADSYTLWFALSLSVISLIGVAYLYRETH
jgi:hypothetical protein